MEKVGQERGVGGRGKTRDQSIAQWKGICLKRSGPDSISNLWCYTWSPEHARSDSESRASTLKNPPKNKRQEPLWDQLDS